MHKLPFPNHAHLWRIPSEASVATLGRNLAQQISYVELGGSFPALSLIPPHVPTYRMLTALLFSMPFSRWVLGTAGDRSLREKRISFCFLAQGLNLPPAFHGRITKLQHVNQLRQTQHLPKAAVSKLGFIVLTLVPV
ncbi:interleukin-6 [Platysternon megacephalum]|uniref:Interleukin-6 n=1 Tax=Platysternon megacephalum TaxID=55544 RepID=A0A4D9EHL8_9SAUR|nr:interleukin-6 [Platysternon megacephalum]